MSSSLFGSDVPWENGWANENEDRVNRVSSEVLAGAGSTYLSSPPVFDHGGDEGDEVHGGKLPPSYRVVIDAVLAKVKNEANLQVEILEKLVDAGVLSRHQQSKLMDVIVDHSLGSPVTYESLKQILGLIALELDLPGSGDYVTLQFRIANPPELPRDVVQIFSKGGGGSGGSGSGSRQSETKEEFIDPLRSQLADTSISEHNSNNEWKKDVPGSVASKNLGPKDAAVDRTVLERDHDTPPINSSEITEYVNNIRNKFKPLVGQTDLVRVKEVPEKEGLVFKHINYIITHDLFLGMHGPSGTKKVIRRYSDFVWLLEFLLKKYPFRVIPGLPPKKFSGSSPDSQFLQKRRRGLHRFLNQLVRHPILVQEPVVVTFLSVPTDMASWRKQARVDYSLEFKGCKILPDFINRIWPALGTEFTENWKKTETHISSIIGLWTKIVILVERYERRQQQIAFDNNKFLETISRIQALGDSLYPHTDSNKVLESTNVDDMNAINDSLGRLSSHFNKSSQALVDESYSINVSLLEKFKNYLDYLYSFLELFERCKKLLLNNISQLQSRLRENEEKYTKLCNDDPDIKGSEVAKLRQTIINDKQEIFQQLNRDWLVKECCLDEYLMFQETQYLISEIWIDWCRGRLSFSGAINSELESLTTEITNGMPLER